MMRKTVVYFILLGYVLLTVSCEKEKLSSDEFTNVKRWEVALANQSMLVNTIPQIIHDTFVFARMNHLIVLIRAETGEIVYQLSEPISGWLAPRQLAIHDEEAIYFSAMEHLKRVNLSTFEEDWSIPISGSVGSNLFGLSQDEEHLLVPFARKVQLIHKQTGALVLEMNITSNSGNESESINVYTSILTPDNIIVGLNTYTENTVRKIRQYDRLSGTLDWEVELVNLKDGEGETELHKLIELNGYYFVAGARFITKIRATDGEIAGVYELKPQSINSLFPISWNIFTDMRIHHNDLLLQRYNSYKIEALNEVTLTTRSVVELANHPGNRALAIHDNQLLSGGISGLRVYNLSDGSQVGFIRSSELFSEFAISERYIAGAARYSLVCFSNPF